MTKKNEKHIKIVPIADKVIISLGEFTKDNQWQVEQDVTMECLEAVRDLFITTKNPEDKMNGIIFKDEENKKLYKLILAQYNLLEDSKEVNNANS